MKFISFYKQMKLFYLLLIASNILVYVHILAPAIQAQESFPIPDSMSGLVGLVLSLLASSEFAGWVTNFLTDGIKNITTRLPILTPVGEPAIAGFASKLIVALLAAVTSAVVVYATPAINYIDESGIWLVIAGALVVAQKQWASDRSVPEGTKFTTVSDNEE